MPSAPKTRRQTAETGVFKHYPLEQFISGVGAIGGWIHEASHLRCVGHKHVHYKIESCLNHKDTHVLSGSEDGKLYVWDLVEAKLIKALEVLNTRVCHSLSHHPTRVGLLAEFGSKMIVTDLKEQSSS